MSGQGIVFDLSAPIDLEGAVIEMVVRPDSAFVASGASLQIFAQVKGKLSATLDWPGEWNCWSSNASLTANTDQTISCTINEGGTFSQTQFDVQVVLQAARGALPEAQTAAGTVLVKSTKVTLAGSAQSSSSSAPASSSSSNSSSGVVVSSSSPASSTPGSSASSSSAPGTGGNVTAPISTFITVDQFGYLPNVQKVAVVRDPQTGFDSGLSFTPGNSYQVVNFDTGAVAATVVPVAWNSGQTSPVAGDKTWWVDFSSVTAPGTYTLVDTQRNVRSPEFKIANDVYKPVLKHAVRYFYYQRAGFAKQTPYADARWTDSASHLKAGQDQQSRLFTDKNNASTEKDLSGGWYDAGDYNKYTNWHADYLIALLQAYIENPSVWTDDFNIPESGNGIPDLLDEIKWGFDWLKKMQESNGSVLSIQGVSHEISTGVVASPPSTATGRSYYGPASTSATLGSAAAFALGAKVFSDSGFGALATYAVDLKTRAENAWTWANANPSVIIHNNDASQDSRFVGLGAGNQEVDNAGRAEKKVRAAIYLFAATGGNTYHDFAKASLGGAGYHVDMWNEERLIMPWLYYSRLPNADATTANNVRSRYNTTMADQSTSTDNFGQINNKTDAYRAHLGASNFTWGSNRSMSRKGNSFMNLITYNIGTHGSNSAAARNAASGYLNYLHGTNPLGMVYLSNMYEAGAYKSVDSFYHTWFTDGSAKWDDVKESEFGPAPGFLVGGPNPAFAVDSCCAANLCYDKQYLCQVELIPPKGQPPMKSYLGFNTSWPLNSWQVSENHNDYQVAYIRLLARFSNNQ